MSHREPHSKLLASEIARYSDAELDRYLETTGRMVTVEDPENLPESFIQRLRVRAGASEAEQSRPVDLDRVSARLEEVSADKQFSPRLSSSGSTTTRASSEPEEHYRHCLENETELYNELVNAGGRPSHPISLNFDVAKNLEEYREILSYWQLYPDRPDSWMVFSYQLGTWKIFRMHQRSVREQEHFPAWCQQLQDRLKTHGFERPVQLEKESDRQDKLTTWIEFLNYHYWQYDNMAKFIRRSQSRHDKAWNVIVDSNALKPFETEDSLWEFGTGLKLQNEEVEAEKAVESATSCVKSAEKVLLIAQSDGLSEQSLSQIELKLSEARFKLATTTESYKQISKRRNLIVDFHYKTKSHRIAKKDAAKQIIFLRWILQQVPLIELELQAAKMTEADLTRGNRGHQQSLKQSRAKSGKEEPISKRHRQDDKNHLLSDPWKRAFARDRETQLNSEHCDSINEDIDDHALSNRKACDPKSSEPLSIQPDRIQNSGASEVRTHRRSLRHSTPRASIAKPEPNKLARVALGAKAQLKKSAKRGEKPSDLSIAPPRKSTRIRKSPERFR